ncbi:MAG: S8 family peptidase [Casimicrobiaceae bacterium]
MPPFLRRLITRKITRAFLRDVNDFLFDAERRQDMEQGLVDRLTAGGGPFVIIAHSQGSMIAYDVLRQLTAANCQVPLFVTIGSPLGMAEVQDVFRQWIPDGVLRVPECVAHWVNVADPFDPVAADKSLADEYACAAGQTLDDFLVLNPESPHHPHSGTGYLRTAPVQDEVLKVVGNAFSQHVAKFVIAKDLVAKMEDGRREERYPTLIQLATKVEGSMDVVRRELIDAIRAMIRGGDGARKSDVESEIERAGIEPLKRYVAAQLTRLEIEHLRARFIDLKIERVWRDAEKRALVFASTHTIQASPAVLGYGATGRDIGWAVLDTGVRGDHPHFQEYANIKRQWDCRKPGPPKEFSPGETKFDELDKQGHGTHVAGIIGGNKKVPLKAGAKPTLFSGMAPETAIYGFKVLDDRGNGQDSWIIKALDAIATFNESAGRLIIAGVNLSLGGNFDPSVYACGHTPLCEELRRLWNQGVLVCLAAGNEGYALLQGEHGQIPSNMDLSIGDPANLDEALAVGSVHKTNPHTYGVSYFSSRGPTADGRRKPDLVAPGERILSALHSFKPPVASSEQTVKDLYVEMSGTSMAAPHVSGLLAGFLSVRREFIGYPDRVKRILLDNCTDLGRDQYIQGRGMPNLIRMLANS